MSITRAFPVLLLCGLLAACAKQPVSTPAASATTSAADTSAATTDTFAFKIGSLTAFSLRDGELRFPNDGKTIGVGHSPEEIAKLLQAAGASTTELVLSIQPLLVKSGDKVLLFDTGVAGNMGPGNGKLVASMKQAGFDPLSVTDIFISHAHGDHVGGLINENGTLTFPNAAVHLSTPELAFLKGMNDETAKMYGIGKYAALIAAVTPKLADFAPGSEIIPGVVKAVDIKGHTPGHSGYLISSGSESLLYIGDAAHHYVISVQEPEWRVNFDGDAPVAQASRKALIEQSASSGQRIYAVHFPFPGIGKFTKDGDHFVWTPEH